MPMFACALGGEYGTTLFALCAPGSRPDEVRGKAAGAIYTVARRRPPRRLAVSRVSCDAVLRRRGQRTPEVDGADWARAPQGDGQRDAPHGGPRIPQERVPGDRVPVGGVRRIHQAGLHQQAADGEQPAVDRQLRGDQPGRRRAPNGVGGRRPITPVATSVATATASLTTAQPTRATTPSHCPSRPQRSVLPPIVSISAVTADAPRTGSAPAEATARSDGDRRPQRTPTTPGGRRTGRPPTSAAGGRRGQRRSGSRARA